MFVLNFYLQNKLLVETKQYIIIVIKIEHLLVWIKILMKSVYLKWSVKSTWFFIIILPRPSALKIKHRSPTINTHFGNSNEIYYFLRKRLLMIALNRTSVLKTINGQPMYFQTFRRSDVIKSKQLFWTGFVNKNGPRPGYKQHSLASALVYGHSYNLHTFITSW